MNQFNKEQTHAGAQDFFPFSIAPQPIDTASAIMEFSTNKGYERAITALLSAGIPGTDINIMRSPNPIHKLPTKIYSTKAISGALLGAALGVLVGAIFANWGNFYSPYWQMERVYIFLSSMLVSAILLSTIGALIGSALPIYSNPYFVLPKIPGSILISLDRDNKNQYEMGNKILRHFGGVELNLEGKFSG